MPPGLRLHVVSDTCTSHRIVSKAVEARLTVGKYLSRHKIASMIDLALTNMVCLARLRPSLSSSGIVCHGLECVEYFLSVILTAVVSKISFREWDT